MNNLIKFRSKFMRVALMLTLAVMTFPIEAWADDVKYLDANRIEQTANAQSIASSDKIIKLPGGWYYANGNVTAQGLDINGDANIILCDEAKMTMTNPDNNYSIDGIYADYGNRTIAIYGQRNGTGSFTNNGNYSYGLYANKINIFGGTIKAEGIGGIWARKDVIIIGGQVTAIATKYFGIRAGYDADDDSDIILGWTNPDDFINANSYKIGGTGSVKTAAGKRFVAYNMASDDDISANCIIGDASSTSATAIGTDISLTDATATKTIAGKTLRPLNGYTVSTTDNKISLKNGTIAKNVDFTITTGTGTEAAPTVTTSYYIYPVSTSTATTITLNYSSEVPTGYVLEYKATKTSDNSDVTSTVISGSTLTMPAYDISVSATLKTIIPSVAITDITAPVTLSAFDTQATCSTTGVTSNSVAWKNGSTTVTGNAAVGIAYTVEVTLTPTSDYTFTNTTTATINGNTATPTLNANGTLTVAYTFSATTKVTLNVSGTATATAEYGKQVKDISISGLTVTYGDTQVDGNWAFASTCTDVPAVGGTTAYTATFTPSSGADNYNTLTQDIVPTIYAYTVSLGKGTGDANDWTITAAGNAITPTSVVSSGKVVTLNYTGKPANYNIGGYIVKDADGGDVNVTETEGVFSFNMPAKNVTIYGVKYYMTNVPYIGWDDTNKTYTTDAETPDGTKVWVLDGTETTLGTSDTETWYVSNTASTANENKGLFYNQGITLNCDVNLILADGSAMTITTTSDPALCNDHCNLAIYGQVNGTGSLWATGKDDGILVKNITINGGQVTATGNEHGILAANFITLGWSSPANFIEASSYDGFSVQVAEEQYFTYGNTCVLLSGTLDADQISAIAGEKLTPVSDIIPIPKGSWATYYSDQPLTLGTNQSGAALYTISSVTDTEAVLSSSIDAAPKNTPLLVYNGSDQDKDILLIPSTEPDLIVSPAPEFKGTATDKEFSADDMNGKQFYVLAGGKMFAPVSGAGTIAAHRCWLELDNTNAARSLVIIGNDDEPTSIENVQCSMVYGQSDSWYDLQGRKLEGKPKRKGAFIHGGKIVILRR